MSARSYLYVPGNRPAKLTKAAERGADATIVDLEDAVPAAEKSAARDAVVDWLSSVAGGPEVWVRVNSGPLLAEDVRALAPCTSLRGIYVPKVSSPDELTEVDRLLGDRPIGVTALIETASGVLDVRAIASAPRVVRLALGEADLGAELAIDPSADGREFAAVRTMVVLASAAARIDAPVAPVTTDFSDLDALRRSTEELRRMGFGARAAIHPAQVPVINEVFTPTPDEVRAARELIALAREAGGAAFTGPDGRMVDEPVIRAARRVLARAGE